MPVTIIDTLQRGGAGTAAFPITKEDDARLSYLTVADLTARDAIAEWKRLPFMRVHVISEATDYRLGANTTIAGQVWTEVDSLLPGTYQLLSEKNQPGGYVGLESNSKINPAYIDNIYVNNSYVVADNTARNALSMTTGDVVTVTDDSKIYVKLNNDPPPNVDADFAELLFPGSVLSVNGMVGAVIITVADLLAVPANATAMDSFISSSTAVLALNGTVSNHTIQIADLEADVLALQSAVGGPALIPAYNNLNSYAANQAVRYQELSGRYNLYVAGAAISPGEIPGVDADWLRLGDYYTTTETTGLLASKANLVGGVVPINETNPAAIAMTYIAANLTARNAITPQTNNMRVYVTANNTNYIYAPGHPLADPQGFVTETDKAVLVSFLELTDTPDTYSGQANKIVRVKPDETGLEFVVGNPGHEIQNSGVSLPTEPLLNFTNAITASDNAGVASVVKWGGALVEHTTLSGAFNVGFTNTAVGVGVAPGSITATAKFEVVGSITATDHIIRLADNSNNQVLSVLNNATAVLGTNGVNVASFTIAATGGFLAAQEWRYFSNNSTLLIETPVGNVGNALNIGGTANFTTDADYTHVNIRRGFTLGTVGSRTYKSLQIAPTYNVSNGSHTVIGIDYNPTITSIDGVQTHLAFRSTSGKLQIGSSLTEYVTITPSSKSLFFQGMDWTSGNSPLFRFQSAGSTYAGGGTVRFMELSSSHVVASGSTNFAGLTLNFEPQTSGSSGTFTALTITSGLTSAGSNVFGIDYNPFVGTIAGTHYAFRATSGVVHFGSSTITSNTKFEVRGLGLTTDLTQRWANSGGTMRMSLSDAGEFIVGSSSATYVTNTQLSSGSVIYGGGTATIAAHGSTETFGVLISSVGLTFRSTQNTAGGTANTAAGFRFDSTGTINPTNSTHTTFKITTLNGFAPASGSASYIHLTLTPTYNTSGSYSGIAYGINYQPNLSGVVGLTHIAARFTSGNILVGATTITAATRFDLRGTGNTNTTWSLRLASSTDVNRFRFRDDGIMFIDTVPANDNALTQVLVRDGATGEIKYRDSSSIGSVNPAWLLASGGILTGANTITGTSVNTIKYVFDSLGVTQTNGAGLWMANTTAATVGNQQISPSLVLEGQGWKTDATAGSQSVKFSIDVLTAQGTSAPTGGLKIRSSINNGAYVDRLTIDSGGAGLVIHSNTTMQNSAQVTGTNNPLSNSSTLSSTSNARFQSLGNVTSVGPHSGFRDQSTLNSAAGSFTSFLSQPTVTTITNLTGFDHDPINPANISGTHIAYRATSGSFLSGTALPPTVGAYNYVSSATTSVAFSARNTNGGTGATTQMILSNDLDNKAIITLLSSTNSGMAGPNSLNLGTIYGGIGTIGFLIASSVRYQIHNYTHTWTQQGGNPGGATFLSYTQSNHTGGVQLGLVYTGGAHTTLTAAEATDINFNLARTIQFTGSTGFAIQRAFIVQAPTYAFQTATGTITDAVTLAITGAPIVGTNAAITRRWALTSGNGDVLFANGGLSVNAPSFAVNGLSTSRRFYVGLSSSEDASIGAAYIKGTSDSSAFYGSTFINGYTLVSGDNLAGTAAYLRLNARNATTDKGFDLNGGFEINDVIGYLTSGDYHSNIIGVSMAIGNLNNINGGDVRINGGAKATVGTADGNVILANLRGKLIVGGTSSTHWTDFQGTAAQTIRFQAGAFRLKDLGGSPLFVTEDPRLRFFLNNNTTATDEALRLFHTGTVTQVGIGMNASDPTANVRLDIRGQDQLSTSYIIRGASSINTQMFYVTNSGNLFAFNSSGIGQAPIASNVLTVGYSVTSTSGSINGLSYAGAFVPASGTATFTAYRNNHIINQTGGANGLTAGFISSPNIQATVDHTGFKHDPTTPGNISGAHIAFHAVVGPYLYGSLGLSATFTTARLQVRENATTVIGFLAESTSNSVSATTNYYLVNDIGRSARLTFSSSTSTTLGSLSPNSLLITTSANDAALMLGTNGNSIRMSITGTGLVTFGGSPTVGTPWHTYSQLAANSGTPTFILYTGAAHTAMTAGATLNEFNYNLARTIQWASNTTVANYRSVYYQAPTLAFASATGTVTKAATVSISGAPIVGTNAAITASYALDVESGVVRLGSAPANDDALTEILARDSTTGAIKYRSAASLGGGGGGFSVAGNALEASGSTIDWGGALTQMTQIDENFDILFGSTTPIRTFSVVSDNATGGAGIGFRVQENTDPTQVAYIALSIGEVAMEVGDSFSIAGYNMTVNNVTIYSDTLGFQGVVYNADYSAGFTPQSLVDKNYSDTHVTGLTITNVAGLTGDVLVFNGTDLTWTTLAGSVGTYAELQMANGSGGFTNSTLFNTGTGSLGLGGSSSSGTSRTVAVDGSGANITLNLESKGTGLINLNAAFGYVSMSANQGHLMTTIDSTSSDVTTVLTLYHSSSSPGNNMGVGLGFRTTTTGGTSDGARLDAIAADVSSGSQDFDFSFKLMTAGAAVAERFRILSTGTQLIPNVTAAPGSNPANGVYMYANDISASSVLHVRNEAGDIIKLYKQTALTTVNSGTINSGDAGTDTILNNMRTRINELESKLQTIGYLA